jgi:hypothetical protein
VLGMRLNKVEQSEKIRIAREKSKRYMRSQAMGGDSKSSLLARSYATSRPFCTAALSRFRRVLTEGRP